MAVTHSLYEEEIHEIEVEDRSCRQRETTFDVDSVVLPPVFTPSTSHKALLEKESSSSELGSEQRNLPQKPKENLLQFSVNCLQRAGFLKIDSPTIEEIDSSPRLLDPPSKTFHRLVEERDEVSRTTPAPPLQGLREGINLPFLGEIRWEVLKKAAKDWLRNPKSLAVLIWGVAVGVSGALLFLVMVGLLDRELPEKSQRDLWFEVNNQILNALFALMCLYHHPGLFYHLWRLCRWNLDDIINLRKTYSKNGTYKPHEWRHMMVVVLLLQLGCFAQYVLCGLNWGYKRPQRPAVGVGISMAVAIGAPAAAGMYNMLSPLGKEYEIGSDLEAGNNADTLQSKEGVELGLQNDRNAMDKFKIKLYEKRYFFASRESEREEAEPEWKGGLFDCWTDPAVAGFSCLGAFCVFGWNMDRLGFGNMYVHIVTFVLLCMAPFWIFNLAAININDARVREFLGITGIVLCVFGLLYGGFWRIQMRKRYNLPASRWCIGQPNVTDCVQWLFCSVCSLSQEVRTADFYNICKEKTFVRSLSRNSPGHTGTSNLSTAFGQHPRSQPLLPPVVNSPPWLLSVQAPSDVAPSPISLSQGPVDSLQSSAASVGRLPFSGPEGAPVRSTSYPSARTFEPLVFSIP